MIGRMEFIDGARPGRNDWWRYVLGLALIAFATLFIGGVPFAGGAVYVPTAWNPGPDGKLTHCALIGVPPRLSLSPSLFPVLMAFVAVLHIEIAGVGSEFWLVMGFYFAFGVALALFTLRDNGLELALGIHAANNLFTALFANFKGSAVESPSIFTASGFTPWYSLVSTLIGLVVIYALFFGRRQQSQEALGME